MPFYYYYFNLFFFLTVNPPKISRHPKNQSVAIGVNIEFSIEATGKSIQFQWQKDGNDLMNSGKYYGVHTDRLRIVAVEGIDEGDYRCLVENDVGRLFSDVALLSFGKLLAFATCICSKMCNQILEPFLGSKSPLKSIPFAGMLSFSTQS